MDNVKSASFKIINQKMEYNPNLWTKVPQDVEF